MQKSTIGLFLLIITLAPFSNDGISVTYSIGGEKYEGFYVDAGQKAPFVLLVHDWDGVNEYEQARARMLGRLGYTVFAADLFGKGVRPGTLDEKKERTGALYSNRVKMRRLLHEAVMYAEKRGASIKNGVAVGYCFGGAAVLELARSGEALRGFVIFHGGLETPADQNYAAVRGEILVLHGSADKAVPLEQFTDLAAHLEAAGVAHEMTLYGGADHAFTVFNGERYNAAADTVSWRRFTAFLEATVTK